jgi:Ca2+-binding EF-hand superfamily protein
MAIENIILKPIKLTFVALKELEQKTQMKKDQIINYHNNFLLTCPNGRMTKDIFKKMFSNFQPAISTAKKAKKYCDYVFQ